MALFDFLRKKGTSEKQADPKQKKDPAAPPQPASPRTTSAVMNERPAGKIQKPRFNTSENGIARYAFEQHLLRKFFFDVPEKAIPIYMSSDRLY